MSGFAYPACIFNSDVYNPAFYLSLDPSGFLSYEYAQTLYLSKNDFRLTYITGITPSVATAGVAIVLDNDLSLTGLGTVSCDSLTVNGVSITGLLPSALTGTTLALTGNNNLITLTNTNSLGRSTIYFSGDSASSSWEYGSRNTNAGPNENSCYWFNQSQFRMVLRNNGSLWIQNGIECTSLNSTSLSITGTNDMITLNNSNAISRMSIQFDGDNTSSTWETGVQCSNNGSQSNHFYWFNQSAYRMVLRNNGSLLVQSNIECNGLSSSSQIDCTILNCTNYGIIENILDIGGQLTSTAGDVSIRSGDVVIDDDWKFIIARSVSSKDINSSIYSAGLSQLTISSIRGGGSIHFEANRNGGASTLGSYIFTDGGVASTTVRRGLMVIYPTQQVRIGGVSELSEPNANPYYQLEVGDGIKADGFRSDSLSYPSFGRNPKFIWESQTSGMDNDSSAQCGIGPHDATGNRTRIGIGYVNFCSRRKWSSVQMDSSGTGCSMYAGSWNTTSDLRLKTDITAIEYGLDTIMQLNPVRYMYKTHPWEDFNLGLIAQEVLPIVPECVSTSGEENDREESPVMLSIEYTQLVPVLIKAVQELSAVVETLTKRLDRIEARPVIKNGLKEMGLNIYNG